jgi:hypothetical protein
VHRLVISKSPDRKVLIVPIRFGRLPAWNAYTIEEIDKIEAAADDFAGEYLCEPSAGHDILFDRACLDKQEKKEPVKTLADFKLFHAYDPSHRYGSGHDVAGGVGLDSSTSVFIDFSTIPARVVGTFLSNTIKPDTFGDEIEREADITAIAERIEIKQGEVSSSFVEAAAAQSDAWLAVCALRNAVDGNHPDEASRWASAVALTHEWVIMLEQG